MTKHLHQLSQEFQRHLLEAGGAHRNQMDPILREGWAALLTWHEAGERLWRLDPDAAQPDLPPGLLMATSPLHSPALCYIGPSRAEWIIVGRIAAGQPIRIADGVPPYGYPEPMIVYLTEEPGTGYMAGCLNLGEAPTWADIYLPAGQGQHRALTQDDIAIEETRLYRALRHWYCPPAIVA